MKVEIMASGKFNSVVENLNIDARLVYQCPDDVYFDYPYYEIWEVEKSDIKNIEMACLAANVLFCYSNGEHRGTAYDLVMIHGVSIIAWLEGSKKDTFNCLTDYFKDCLGVTDGQQICAYSVYLAKTNGMSLSNFWKRLEG